MVKIDAKALGIQKPIELKVTMAVMRKILKTDLAIAKMRDTKGKDGLEVINNFINNIDDAERNVCEVLKLSDKQRKYIDDNIEPMTFIGWFDEFAGVVFTAMMGIEATPENKKKAMK